jgi:hypothetical protein
MEEIYQRQLSELKQKTDLDRYLKSIKIREIKQILANLGLTDKQFIEKEEIVRVIRNTVNESIRQDKLEESKISDARTTSTTRSGISVGHIKKMSDSIEYNLSKKLYLIVNAVSEQIEKFGNSNSDLKNAMIILHNKLFSDEYLRLFIKLNEESTTQNVNDIYLTDQFIDILLGHILQDDTVRREEKKVISDFIEHELKGKLQLGGKRRKTNRRRKSTSKQKKPKSRVKGTKRIKRRGNRSIFSR